MRTVRAANDASELDAKIRQEGVDDIALVKRMYLEGDGEISLIKQETSETPK